MNPIDDQLNRLFRAAAQASQADETAAVPYGLETRVLAAWRNAPAFHFWDNRLLVRAVMVATMIMAVSLWPTLQNHSTSTNPFSDSLQLADSDATVPFDSTTTP